MSSKRASAAIQLEVLTSVRVSVRHCMILISRWEGVCASTHGIVKKIDKQCTRRQSRRVDTWTNERTDEGVVLEYMRAHTSAHDVYVRVHLHI